MQPKTSADCLTTPDWKTAPTHIEVHPGEVHIWRAELSKGEARKKNLWPLLSDEEKRRASEFHFPEDSNGYIVSHGVLRDILYRYRRQVELPIRLEHGPSGKPYLRQQSDSPRLHFNLSHSHSLALIGLMLDSELGVDLEQVSSTLDWHMLAGRYFRRSEIEQFGALTESEGLRQFFSLWTVKEAYLKARGEGLAGDLHSSRSSEFTHTDAASDCSFVLFDVDEQYVGALVVVGSLAKVQFWDWKLPE